VRTKARFRASLIEGEIVVPRDGCMFSAHTSLTTLAQEGAGLEMGRLPGRVKFPASLQARPANPVEGEAGGRGESSCSTPRLAPSTPGEGEARRGGEERNTGGGVDGRLACCTSPLLPPPQRAEVVPGCASSLREGRSAHHGG
jgi:hypothetical protein